MKKPIPKISRKEMESSIERSLGHLAFVSIIYGRHDGKLDIREAIQEEKKFVLHAVYAHMAYERDKKRK